jgi:hypothetical protein
MHSVSLGGEDGRHFKVRTQQEEQEDQANAGHGRLEGLKERPVPSNVHENLRELSVSNV